MTFLIPLPFPLSPSPGWTVSLYLRRKQYHASLRTSSWHEYKMSSRSSHHRITGENVSTQALRNRVVAVTIRERCLKQQQSSFPEVNSQKLTHYFQIWQQFIWHLNVIEQAISKQALPASAYPPPPWVWPPWHPWPVYWVWWEADDLLEALQHELSPRTLQGPTLSPTQMPSPLHPHHAKDWLVYVPSLATTEQGYSGIHCHPIKILAL